MLNLWVCNMRNLSTCLFLLCVLWGAGGRWRKKMTNTIMNGYYFFIPWICSTCVDVMEKALLFLTKDFLKLTNQTWMFMNHVYMLAFVDLISELWNYCMRHFEFSCCLYPFSPYVYSTGTIKMKIRMIVSGWRKNGQLERYEILPRGPCWWSYF